MKKIIDFVKIHAGWDEIVFLHGEQLPKGREIEICLSVLRKPSIGGIEVGILYPSRGRGHIRIKMVDDTQKGYIRMCGGLTQAIAKAIVETPIGRHYGIVVRRGLNTIALETDAGLIHIEMVVENQRVKRVTTHMNAYVETLYGLGVETVNVAGIECVSVGLTDNSLEYLVLDVDELSKSYPIVDFWRRDTGSLVILERVYAAFLKQKNLSSGVVYSVLYRLEANRKGKSVQAVFRFYPWLDPGGSHPEFGCGTGSVALGIALHSRGHIQCREEPLKLPIIVGGEHLPENTRVKTQLVLEGNPSRITAASFSHDRIELVAAGTLYLP